VPSPRGGDPEEHGGRGLQGRTRFRALGPRIRRLDARKLVHPDNNSTTLLLAIEDITNDRYKFFAPFCQTAL
jgi:hypothetical protein